MGAFVSLIGFYGYPNLDSFLLSKPRAATSQRGFEKKGLSLLKLHKDILETKKEKIELELELIKLKREILTEETEVLRLKKEKLMK